MSTALRSIGKYELHKRLASSHLNEVWLARDSHSQHYVFLKVFYTHHQPDSEVIRNFVNQAETVASLEHPNLVRLHDVLVYPSSNSNSPVSSMVCLVTDYVDGKTLADYLRSASSTAKMRPSVAMVALFTSIGLVIDYAHQHGVIHGNLKPSNILLTSRKTVQGQFDEPLLTDFSFTKLLQQGGPRLVRFISRRNRFVAIPPMNGAISTLSESSCTNSVQVSCPFGGTDLSLSWCNISIPPLLRPRS